MEPVLEKFTKVLEKDRERWVKNWMVTWEYQEKRKKAKKDYGSTIVSDFYIYNGKEDLVKWMNWITPSPLHLFNNSSVKELIEKSQGKDEEIMKKLDLKYDFSPYKNQIGIINAQDYHIPLTIPSKNKIKTVIDFGAGYGRQANLWASPERVFIGIDAIPSSYCLQNLYYSQLRLPFYEYTDAPTNFKVNSEQCGIYHVPTWRTDVIPSNSVDLIIAIMVLPELNATLLKYIISEFERVLKPGGMWYLRDHGQTVKLGDSFDFDKYMLQHGFSLEYKAHVIDMVDIHGIPRIYRKTDPAVVISQTKTLKQKTAEIVRDLDYQTGGALRKTYRKLKGK